MMTNQEPQELFLFCCSCLVNREGNRDFIDAKKGDGETSIYFFLRLYKLLCFLFLVFRLLLLARLFPSLIVLVPLAHLAAAVIAVVVVVAEVEWACGMNVARVHTARVRPPRLMVSTGREPSQNQCT